MLSRFGVWLSLLAVPLVGCAPASGNGHLPKPASTPHDPSFEFDFIVVGSGAGGGPVASRLARAGQRVLLLEAGEDAGTSLRYQVPAMHALATEDPELAWWYFVDHHSEPGVDARDSKITEDGILYPRGSALGGSTAVNALVTVRSPPSDWNRLAEQLGDINWRASRVAPHHGRVARWLRPELPDVDLANQDPVVVNMLTAAASVHAGEGVFDPTAHPLDIDGTAGELLRLADQDINEALSHGETEGVYRLPLATEHHQRRGTRELLLETVADGHPLTIWTGAFVHRVIFDGSDPPRAIGVEYVRGGAPYQASLRRDEATSEPREVLAAREVILSAGTFNSPQILMLSGVGDPENLEALGIQPRVTLPAVGHNLQDRVEIAVVADVGNDLAIIDGCDLGNNESDPCLDTWRREGGVYGTSGFLATVLRRSTPERIQPNLSIFASPGDARGYYPGYSADALRHHDRFSWLILEAHTHNRDGQVALTSAHPYDRPSIHFRSFDEDNPMADEDLRDLARGIEFVRQIHSRMRLSLGASVTEIWPGPEVGTESEVMAFAREEAWGHHACCTNPMGPDSDPDAVLDSRLRVRGTRGLRVVDASSFPEIPGTFIAHPTFVLSERAASFILEDHGLVEVDAMDAETP